MTGNERALFEQLEPRVLMSATPAPDSGDAAVVEADTLTEQEQNQQLVSEIVFVDASVENYQALIDGLNRNVEVVLIGADENGLDKITESLDGREDVSAIHIISHGTDGEITLGNLQLTQENFADYKTQLASWNSSFSSDADILLYGCNVGEDNHFLQSISSATGADVAASDDLTGAQLFGGDAQLEVTVGTIESPEILDQSTYDLAQNKLGSEIIFDGTTRDDLDTVMQAASAGDTIVFDKDIAIAFDSQISLTKAINMRAEDGVSVVFDGQGKTRLFEYKLGTLDNLFISGDITFENGNTVASFTDGAVTYTWDQWNSATAEEKKTMRASSSIYSDGAGGALFISNADVVLDGITVQNSTSHKYGGGIYHKTGSFELKNSEILNNQASRATNRSSGGGIYSQSSASIVYTGNSVSGNIASSSDDFTRGGGIYAQSSLSIVYTGNSVSGNIAFTGAKPAQGGGIYSLSSTSIVYTSNTISGNTAHTLGSSSAAGGGICNDSLEDLKLYYNTILENSVSGDDRSKGAGVHGFGDVINEVFGNLIALNSGAADYSNRFEDEVTDYNFIEDPEFYSVGNNDLTYPFEGMVEPYEALSLSLLGLTRVNNGDGHALYYEIDAESPLKDKGQPIGDLPAGVDTDQLGRVMTGSERDIGSIEYNSEPTSADNDTKTVEEDGTLSLVTSDFAFSDAEDSTISKVRITALPTNGALYIDGTKVDNLDTAVELTKAQLDAGELTYQPTGDYNGTDTYSFKVIDSGAKESVAAYTFTIAVTAVNDAPEFDGEAHTFTTTTEDLISENVLVNDLFSSVDVDEDARKGIAITDLEAINGVWQYRKLINGEYQWLDISLTGDKAFHLPSTNRIRFNPDGQNGGTSSITYHAWDRTQGRSYASAAITDTGGITAYSSETRTSQIVTEDVNDAPILKDLELFADIINEADEASLTVDFSDVDTSDTNQTVTIDWGDGTIEVKTNVSPGKYVYRHTYTDDPSGSDNDYAISVSIDDGADKANSVVSKSTSVTVNNVAPSSTTIPVGPVDEGDDVSIDLSSYFSDVAGDNDPLTFTATGLDGIALSLTPAGVLTGTPTNAEAGGKDAEFKVYSVTVTAADGDGGTKSETFDLRINNVNQAPTPGSFETNPETDENDSKTIDVIALAEDIDTSLANLTIQDVAWSVTSSDATLSGKGTVTVEDNKLVFTPGTDFDELGVNDKAVVTITYKLNDGELNGVSTTGTVSLTVNGHNDAPEFDGEAHTFATTTEDLISEEVLVNDLFNSIDVDEDARKGIAITDLEAINGVWQYKKLVNGEYQWLDINLTGDKAFHLPSTNRIRFNPDGQNGGTSSITYHAWDRTQGRSYTSATITDTGGITAYSSETRTSKIVTTDVNDAPVLNSKNDFSATDEGTTSNSQTVQYLVDSSDKDIDSVEGMAITGFTAENGNWQYKLSGGVWTDIGSIPAGKALHLDQDTSIRYKHTGEVGGSYSLTFYAWDGSNGVESGVVETIPALEENRGGATAYSTESKSSLITINSINDQPEVTMPATIPVIEDTSKVISGIKLADVDADSAVKLTLSVTSGTINLNDSVPSGVTEGQITVINAQTIEVTALLNKLQATLDGNGLVYSPVDNFNGAVTLTAKLNDLGSSGSGGAKEDSGAVTLQVGAVADTPYIAVESIKGLQGQGSLPLVIDASAGAENEKLSVIISGLPEGFTLSAGLKLGNSWRLTAPQLSNLKVNIPRTFYGTLTVKVTAQSIDGSKVSEVSAPLSIDIKPAVKPTFNNQFSHEPFSPTESIQQLRADVQQLFRQNALQLVAGDSSLHFDQLSLSERALEVIVAIFNDNQIVSDEVAEPSGNADGVKSMDVYDLSGLTELEQQFIKEIILEGKLFNQDVKEDENKDDPEGNDDTLSFLTDEMALIELSQTSEKTPALSQSDLDNRIGLEDTLLGEFDCLSI